MSYLIQSDYLKEIQLVQLNQLLANDPNIQSRAENEAIEKAKSYLLQKYDVNSEITNTGAYDQNVIYKATNRVYVAGDAGLITLYFAIYPFPLFDLDGLYNVGDKVFWKDNVYTCLQSTVPVNSGNIQYGTQGNIPPQNYFPDIPGTGQWGNATAYSVPANTAVTNTAYWMQGDNRSQELLTHIINIALYVLHKRIAPNNIPRLREKSYAEALDWLTGAAEGKINPNLPLLQQKRGGRIRWGGNIKNVNSY